MTPYCSLERLIQALPLTDGPPVPNRDDALRRLLQAVSVAVAGAVAWVTEIAAVRAWLARVGGYVTPSGTPPLGTPPTPPVTLGDDLLLLLRQGGYVVR